MKTLIDTKSAFERINNYIEVNNCQLLAQIIHMLLL